jgi:hypothetical protein
VKRSKLLFLLLISGAVAAQGSRIGVARPAFPYEILDSVPEDVVHTADRRNVADFLSLKNQARAGFTSAVHNVCDQFLHRDLKLAEVAVRLDEAVDKMDSSIAAAYDRMMGRLSAEGSTAVDAALDSSSATASADMSMVKVEASSPQIAEFIVRGLCRSE